MLQYNCISAEHSTDLPEPINLLAGPSVMPVDGVLLPVDKVDLLHSAKHHLNIASERTT